MGPVANCNAQCAQDSAAYIWSLKDGQKGPGAATVSCSNPGAIHYGKRVLHVLTSYEYHNSLGKLFAGLASDLDEAALIEVCDAFAAVTDADLGGKKLLALGENQWDDHFRGRLFEMFEWVAFAATVTYGPLFERLQAAAPEPDEAPAAG